MAGIVDATLTNDQTVQGYEQQAEALDVAREDLRGMQKGTLKDLFNYDKALSERYSSPDSKMYIENAADRERAISGYSDIARGEVSNLYDIMQGVSKARQDLLERVEMLKEQAKKASAGGGGQTGLSPSALLGAMRSASTQTEQPPEPPSKMVQEVLNDPQKKIYWAKNDNGTYAYTVDSATAPRKETAEIYAEYKDPDTLYKEQQSQEDELLDTFGIDRQQLAKLASLEVLDPQLAQAELRKLMVENATAKPKELTADDYKAGVKATDSKKVREQKLEAYYSSPQAMDASTQKEYNFQRSAILNANKLKDLYAQRRNGEISESDFKIKSTNYATSLARAILRKESGATITMQEWQTVMPSIPRVNFRNQNAFERITGQMPEISGIKDGEKTATTKLDDFLEEQYTLNPRLRNEFEKGQQEISAQDSDIQGKLVKAGVVFADDGSVDWSQMPVGSFDELPLGQKIPKALYTLIAEPIIKGLQGYAQLVGTAGIAGVDWASRKLGDENGIIDDLQPEVKEWFIDNVENNYATPTQTAITGGLQTLGGIGAGADIFTLGKASTLKQIGKNALQMGARNLAINSPIFGLGSFMEAVREGEDMEVAGKRFIEGATGQRFTGPFVGLFGKNSITESADVVTAIAGPIIGGKMVEKFFNGKALATPTDDGFKVVEKNIVDMPDHEVAFAQAYNKGDMATAQKVMDGLSDGNPYKQIYKQAIVEAENTTAGTGAFKNILQSVKQRLAGSLFTYDPESVTKSEKYAEKAIAQTKSRTLYGIAKELPVVKAKAGNYVDSHVAQVDKVIGNQSLDDVLGGVMDKVGESSAAQANPTQLDMVRSLLRKMLYSGQPGMDTPEMNRGATTLTSLERMNEARKALNKSINSSWFSNGMPTANKTENLNAMKWIASQVLKDMIKEADPTGNVGRAIESEHIAFAIEPVISKLIQKKGTRASGAGITTRIAYFIDNLFNTVWEPMRIEAVRGLSRSGLKEFRAGLDQLPTGGLTQGAEAGIEAQGFQQKPLQPEMIDIIAGNKAKKAPAQAKRYLGEQAENLVGTRAQQDKALRRLKSIKYK